jgi:hypothetical protein
VIATGAMEALGRFELPTCGLGNRRSIHLSYRAAGFILQEPELPGIHTARIARS